MADNLRWRYGETNPVLLPVDAATVIEIGDLVKIEDEEVLPASAQAEQETEEEGQALFAQRFVGIAMQRSRDGDTAPVRVATSGVFEMPCTSQTHLVGYLVGACRAASGALEDQQVEQVLRPELAKGVVVRNEPTAAAKVLFALRSPYMGQAVCEEHRHATNSQSLSTDKTLTCDDSLRQLLDPGAADRTVTLPNESVSRGLRFLVRNASADTQTLTLLSSDEETELGVVEPGQTAQLWCDGMTWWVLLGAV